LIIFLFWPVFRDILSIFLPIFAKMGLFPKNLFGPIWSPYFGLTSCRKSAKTNEKISQKSWKTLILDNFDHFYCPAHFLRVFPKKRFGPIWSPYFGLTSCWKSAKTNEKISQKSWKTLILGYFDHIYCHAHFLRIFSKNRALSLFYIYDPLTSCQKSKKSNEPFPRTLVN
jgi:hypothetical protein